MERKLIAIDASGWPVACIAIQYVIGSVLVIISVLLSHSSRESTSVDLSCSASKY
jgi:hypothetical protein